KKPGGARSRSACTTPQSARFDRPRPLMGSSAKPSAPHCRTIASGRSRAPIGRTTSSMRKAISLSWNPGGTGRLRALPPAPSATPPVDGPRPPPRTDQAGVRPASRLVNRQGEDALVLGEGILHTVAVMRIDIHVVDPSQSLLEQRQDAEDRIVEITEAAGAIGAAMVRAPRRVEHDA